MERLLALGTVVKVAVGKGQTARLMIIGYYPQNKEAGQVYDYATVLYPFGMCFAPAIQCVNRNRILEVEKEGYLNEAAAEFTKGLPELIKKTNDVILGVLKEEAQKTDAAKAAEAAKAEKQKLQDEVAKAPVDDFLV